MSVLPVLMSVLIVPELQFEKDRPENDGDCRRGENACHRGSDWSPVVRLHLLQEHAHLRNLFEGHLENKFCHLLFRPVTCTRPSFAVTALAFCLYKISSDCNITLTRGGMYWKLFPMDPDSRQCNNILFSTEGVF